MHLIKAFVVAASLIATTPAIHAQPAKQIPLRDFFKNPDQAGHALSPDGQYLAWLAPWQSRRNIYVRPLAGGPATRVTAETARDISSFGWKGSNRLIYGKDFGGDENFHVVSVDRKGEGLKDLTPGEKVKANVVDPLIDDDDHIIVSHNRRDAKVFDVFRINVNTGEEKLIAQNPGNITGWRTDHDGKLRVAITTDGVNTSLLYRDVAAFSDKTRGKRYLYDKAAKKLDLLADVSPWLPESELADMKPIHGEVLAVEPLGAETVVRFRLPDVPHDVLARGPRSVVAKVGDRAPVTFDLGSAHLFDPITTQRIS